MVRGLFEAPGLGVDPDFFEPGHHRWCTHQEVDPPAQILGENLRLAHVPKGVVARTLFFFTEQVRPLPFHRRGQSFARVHVIAGMVFVALRIVEVNFYRNTFSGLRRT